MRIEKSTGHQDSTGSANDICKPFLYSIKITNIYIHVAASNIIFDTN